MSDLLGGRYRMVREIGSGGCGQTFLVEDTHLPSKRLCVVKKLRPYTTDSATQRIIRERFEREAIVLEELGRLSGEIPDLYDYFNEDGEFYLVQEWVEGENLQQRFQRTGPFSASETRNLLVKLLRLLEKVHANGIIHRDIKPHNIILRARDQAPVLIDFGAVKDLYATIVSPDGMPTGSIVIGSPGFMALEQSAGRPVFSSDLYSLGLTAIYLLTGLPPKDLTDKVTGAINWRAHAPQVAEDFAAVLNRATRDELPERFQSAGEMLDALEADEQTRVAIRQVQPLEQLAAPAAVALAAPRRRVWPVWTLAFLLAAGHGAWGYFYWRQNEENARLQQGLSAATADLADTRAAKEAADKRTRTAEDKVRKTEQAAKQIWRLASVANQTGQPLTYEVLNPDGSWESFTLDPDAGKTHWRLNTEIMVRFNQSSGFLRHEKIQVLRDTSTVMGREPNENEQNRARSFAFKKDETSGDIVLE